jgi:hypothetical protein
MTPIQERNRKILQMRKEGVARVELAKQFNLSRYWIGLIERGDQANKLMAERRSKLRAKIRAVDDPEKLWPVKDLLDAIGPIPGTNRSCLKYFKQRGTNQLSLRELMDFVLLETAETVVHYQNSRLLGIKGVSKTGFFSMANGLSNVDLGSRCNEAWQKRISNLNQNWRIGGPRPNPAARQ